MIFPRSISSDVTRRRSLYGHRAIPDVGFSITIPTFRPHLSAIADSRQCLVKQMLTRLTISHAGEPSAPLHFLSLGRLNIWHRSVAIALRRSFAILCLHHLHLKLSMPHESGKEPHQPGPSGSGGGPSNDETERTRLQTERFEKLVESIVSGSVAVGDFASKMRQLGASALESEEWFGVLKEQLDKRGPTDNANERSRSHTPEGLEGEALVKWRSDRDKREADRIEQERQSQFHAAEAVAWKLLEEKSKKLASDIHQTGGPRSNLETLLDILGGDRNAPESSSSTSRSIPTAVLVGAPHLAQFSFDKILDSHIARTWELRQLFATEKALEPIIDNMQAHPGVSEALPRNIWKLIIQDVYVDFDKLHGALENETRFSHVDEAKPFVGNLVLINQDQLAKKHVKNEGEWQRVFRVWKEAVVTLYPHRKDELEAYRNIVDELFRVASGNPLVAISFDREARLRYSKKPFHLDDRNQLLPLTMGSLYRDQHLPQGQKRQNPYSSYGEPYPKRSNTFCYNWNYGFAMTPVTVVGSTESVANVEESIEQRNRRRALLLSRLATARQEAEMNVRVEEAEKGPRSLLGDGGKRKAEEPLAPRYRRGFAWSSNTTDSISPSAINTETAVPLASPPAQLVNDSRIQDTIRRLGPAIRVDTPFNVNKFEELLIDHPNQPFVQSVMRGLREGFWPFDVGRVGC
ncbi:hypothetical protein NMY22_g12584 [Coprinellus aureogranulatus]|nr:hypothetical protein NMY22_g12584 [Coprinellus aureogranulatus]